LDGSLNVIRQAEQAGIKRIIYTSSMATLLNPSGALSDKGRNMTFNVVILLTHIQDWNPITEEEMLVATPFVAYAGAKTMAEHAVWQFADEHKHVDITVCESSVPSPIPRAQRLSCFAQ
jgi:nucleoside-diphosphate-sugar epimerase